LKIVHVIVGAGNLDYFLNAIESVRSHKAGDIVAQYNWVDERDHTTFEKYARLIEERVARLDSRPNRQGLRTGSLYEANNFALDLVRQEYDWVSFMQADMQLMWWDEKILSAAERIIGREKWDGNEISFYTQLPVLGKSLSPYEKWHRNPRTESFSTLGFVDVCLVPLFDKLNQDFRFDGTERSMSDDAANKLSPLHWHPFPYVSPIPFPLTVRDNRRSPGNCENLGIRPILKVSNGINVDFSQAELHPISMEDTIVPNDWISAYPYWPSDTQGIDWIQKRLRFATSRSLSPFAVIDKNGKISPIEIRRFRPGVLAILRSMLAFFSREMILGLKKMK